MRAPARTERGEALMRWRTSRGVVAVAALLVVTARESSALDLQGALREVTDANPSLASRREMVGAARRRIGPAGAWSSPMVEIGAINVPVGGGFDEDMMTMKMIGVQQRVPVFGANGLGRRSATAAADAEGAALELATAELLSMAWEAYGDAYFAAGLSAATAAHRGEMDQLHQAARARYDAGRGRLDDVLGAEAERARLLSDLASFEAEAQEARARLAALMGRESASLGEALEPPPAATLPDDLGAILAGLDERHPRLRELRATADRYRLSARAARRMLWPDLQIGFSYGLREPISGMAQDNMWSATLGFMLPIFAGQRELSEGAEMEAMARASDDDLRAASLDLAQRARGLYARARASARTVSLLADTVVVTQRRAVAASMSAYDAGTADLGRVLEASHALYAEEVALVRARQELVRTEARLLAITANGELFGLSLPEVRRTER